MTGRSTRAVPTGVNPMAFEMMDGDAPPPLPKRKGPRLIPASRSGSRAMPYQRVDGREMVKIGFSATKELADELRRFVAEMPPKMERNAWLEDVIRQAIEREMRKRVPASTRNRGDAGTPERDTLQGRKDGHASP